jgi:hypothetical protein
LNARLDDIQDKIKEKIRERDYLDDLNQELEMVLDEDEAVRFVVCGDLLTDYWSAGVTDILWPGGRSKDCLED